MYLTKEEEKMLEGEYGEGVRKAMEIIVALGKIYNAERLVEVTSVQVSGVSYKNLGDAGIEFLEEWAKEGGKIRVPTTLNPAGMDLEEWNVLGFSEAFARKQLKVIDAFTKMGIPRTCTCTPYFIGNVPKFGDHIAWAESSAVCFANSVIGARTNREGGPSALAAAITGRTALYGFHLDENRIPTYVVKVSVDIEGCDFGALGYFIGKIVKTAVPLFEGIKHATVDELKQLGAALAAGGGVALYHVKNITPEAEKYEGKGEIIEFGKEELKEAYQMLNDDLEKVDLVSVGCPHASFFEIEKIAKMIKGKTLRVPLWITTSYPVKTLAERSGLAQEIRKAGGYIVADTCVVVSPIKDLGYENVVVNSAKAAHYLRSQGKKVGFGPLEKCVEAAVSGVWK